MKKKLISIVLMAATILSMTSGCTSKTEARADLESGDRSAAEEPVTEGELPIFQLADAQSGKKSMTNTELKKAYSEFVFGLMARCASQAEGENVLISADSVLFALEMVAAGADGETLNQMMQTLVPGADNATAFMFSVDHMKSLESESLKIANSMWIDSAKADSVYDDYLEYVQHHFDAEVSLLPLDPSAIPVINDWVSEKTEDRIQELIDKLDPNTLMVLVNAIAFDGTWATRYEEGQTYEGTFQNGHGESQEVTYLRGTEDIYMESETATGFLKDYDDGKYAFITILPQDADVDINEFIANMTPEEYWAFWDSRDMSGKVMAVMPKFTSEYDVSLSGILQDMGIADAFSDAKADFSHMTPSQVFIGQVIHKTFISVNENGTEAAAATAVEMRQKSAAGTTVEHEVICDRPYAYAIVDKATGLPVFLGTVESV